MSLYHFPLIFLFSFLQFNKCCKLFQSRVVSLLQNMCGMSVTETGYKNNSSASNNPGSNSSPLSYIYKTTPGTALIMLVFIP